MWAEPEASHANICLSPQMFVDRTPHPPWSCMQVTVSGPEEAQTPCRDHTNTAACGTHDTNRHAHTRGRSQILPGFSTPSPEPSCTSLGMT